MQDIFVTVGIPIILMIGAYTSCSALIYKGKTFQSKRVQAVHALLWPAIFIFLLYISYLIVGFFLPSGLQDFNEFLGYLEESKIGGTKAEIIPAFIVMALVYGPIPIVGIYLFLWTMKKIDSKYH